MAPPRAMAPSAARAAVRGRIGAELDDGVEGRVDGLDAAEVRVDGLGRGDASVADQLREADGGVGADVVGGHGTPEEQEPLVFISGGVPRPNVQAGRV